MRERISPSSILRPVTILRRSPRPRRTPITSGWDGGTNWNQPRGFNSTPLSGATVPPVTAIAVDPANAARVAVTYAGQSTIDATYRTHRSEEHTSELQSL